MHDRRKRLKRRRRVSGSNSMEPVFHALDVSGGTYSNDVIDGAGVLTEGRSGTIYLPDDAGIWQSFASNVAGKVYASARWWLYGAPATTNGQIQSNDLTDVEWTAANMTVAQDVTGMRNDATAACTLTATAGNATVQAEALVEGADDQTTRWFIKRKTGIGTINISVNGGGTWQDVTTEVDSTTGFNECIEHLAATANPQIGIRIVTDTDAVIVGNAEVHVGKTQPQVRGTSPLFTVAAPAGTNATDLNFDDANHDDTSGAYYFEFKNVGLGASPDVAGVLGLGGSARLIYTSANSSFKAYDGTTQAVGPSITLAADDVEYKIGLAYGSDLQRVNTDGVWGTAAAYDGAYDNANSKLDVMHNNAFSNVPNATMLMRNLRRYDVDYDMAQEIINDLTAS